MSNLIVLCPVCGGTGVSYDNKETSNYNGSVSLVEPYKIDCPACNGLGILSSNNQRLESEIIKILAIKHKALEAR